MTSLAGMPEDSGGRFAGKVLKAGVVAPPIGSVLRVARPMPRVPPVMRALRFLSFIDTACTDEHEKTNRRIQIKFMSIRALRAASCSGAADGQKFNPGHGLQFFFQKAIRVHQNRTAHLRNQRRPVRLAELRPLGADSGGFRLERAPSLPICITNTHDHATAAEPWYK